MQALCSCAVARIRSSVPRLFFASLLFLAPPLVHAANYTLYIKTGTLSVTGAGGATLKVWGFTDNPSAGPMIPGPVLESREGETVTVTVYNQHTQSHNFVIRGVTTDQGAITAGNNKTYVFQTPKAGVYLVSDTLNSVNREMGLYGALVVRPAGGVRQAWTGGPAFGVDNDAKPLERLWVVSDMDKLRWNDVAGNGGSVNTGTYKPNYFLMNGYGGFDAMHDPKTVLQGPTGQTGLVRIVNAGQFDHSLHFHANHFLIIDSDGTRPTKPEWGDTINVKAGTTAMVLYTMKPGIFPMHIHTAQMETANGVYLNGVATLLIGN
jgi:FtsP/CotA-like multicopper oxidase with cupredoxin domain